MRERPRPPLNWRDRLFWVALSRVWSRWREALCIVKPETVVRWHRQGWRLYWRWKSRPKKSGCPQVEREIRDLVRRMADENPTWGAPRIHGELLKLGFKVAQSIVSRYMPKRRKPASETWRTFLKNHAAGIVACDFFTVPTITFGLLYGFVLVRHCDRRILHIGVTTHPSAAWATQ